MNFKFNILAMAALGKGLSGSDRIFIELSKNLQKRKFSVSIYLWEEGYKMCQGQNLGEVKYVLWKVGSIKKLGFVITYIFRVVKSIYKSLTLNLSDTPDLVLYSASDFWMDSIPGWIIKKRHSNITWVATFYLAAPNPFYGFKEKGEKVIPSAGDFLYWLMQKIPYFLIKKDADLVCLTSEPDIERFPEHKLRKRYLVIKGGVNFRKENLENIPQKKYQAVFQGRFHKQKGVLELVQIWKTVTNQFPQAKLIMIGDGPLMHELKSKIKKLGLEDNIILEGIVFDGPRKDQIFKESQIVVHPAVYDSGGMAAAEAMAFGLPGVSFDLEALKSYYPKGMLKANINDLDNFSEKILLLLNDKILYKKISEEAISLIKSQWDWSIRTDQFLKKLNEVVIK